jgi:hypothetical protein
VVREIKDERSIEMSGTASASILGHLEQFELLAWADEQPGHAHPV